jgi:hypothetical protein
MSIDKRLIKTYMVVMVLIVPYTILLAHFLGTVTKAVPWPTPLYYKILLSSAKVAILVAYIPLGIVFEKITKMEKKIRVPIAVAASQFPVILIIGFIAGQIGVWKSETYGLAMAFSVFTIWGFPFGVIISEKLKYPIKRKAGI